MSVNLEAAPAARKNRIRMSGTSITFNILGYFIITVIALVCVLPFVLMVSGSFSDEQAIRFQGYSILPRGFTTQAYEIIFKAPDRIVRAYANTIFITAAGTVVGLFLITMTAYVISRRDFKYRNVISFFFYFTTLFNGGMVCTYIFYIQYLHIKDSYLALILPGLMNVFYLLIMRSFVNTIPIALVESAKIDGASEYRIFLQIILPLLGSGLATIGLFMALNYWNDWYNAMLYINTETKYPLQYMMYHTLMRAQMMTQLAQQLGVRAEAIPSNTLKLAMAVVTTGPIVLVYPFVQKYFVKGITIGSVKG